MLPMHASQGKKYLGTYLRGKLFEEDKPTIAKA